MQRGHEVRARACAFVLAAIIAAVFPQRSFAQPAPTFQSDCRGLRDAVATLKNPDGDLVTIAVEGDLTIVHSDGALVYLVVCRAPNPQVMCVTYETNDRKVGDRVILTGAYVPRGPNHIQLDPCLHHPPGNPPR